MTEAEKAALATTIMKDIRKLAAADTDTARHLDYRAAEAAVGSALASLVPGAGVNVRVN